MQLDSDDLYSATDVLQRIVDEFKRGPYAMVVGSYTIVDFDLQPIPPGLVDHREWTDENGHNNALRIAGLGAPGPSTFPPPRRIGFPNVSFGEDYAVVLRIAGHMRSVVSTTRSTGAAVGKTTPTRAAAGDQTTATPPTRTGSARSRSLRGSIAAGDPHGLG